MISTSHGVRDLISSLSFQSFCSICSTSFVIFSLFHSTDSWMNLLLSVLVLLFLSRIAFAFKKNSSLLLSTSDNSLMKKLWRINILPASFSSQKSFIVDTLINPCDFQYRISLLSSQSIDSFVITKLSIYG